MPEKEVSDTSPALESNVPDRARGLSVAETAPTLVETWARSAAFTYFVLLTVAALAIGLGWPLVEWAFDARRLFR